MSIIGAAQQQDRNRAATTSNDVAPSITGVGYTGLTMTKTSDGTWSNVVGGYTYQWQADSVNISGATGPTYLVTPATEGKSIRCNVINNGVVGSSNAIHNWVPSDLAGLSARWDRSNTATVLLSGTAVTGINDSTGNGRNAAQANSSYRPASDGLLNGKTAFSFIDNDRYLDVGGPALPTGNTTYVAIGRHNTSATSSFFANSGGSTLIPNGATTSSTNILRVNGVDDAAGSQQIYDGEIAQSVTTRITVRDKMINSSMVIVSTNAAATATFSISRAGGTYIFRGDMGEAFIVSAALTDTEKRKIQGYAAWKWNFVASLGTHAYDASNGAPTV